VTRQLLREVVYSWGVVTDVVVDDPDPIFISSVAIRFSSGNELFIEAVGVDDSVRILQSEVTHRPGSVEVSEWMPWSTLVGKRLEWVWTMMNQQGYVDGVQFESSGQDQPALQLMVIASSLKPYLVMASPGPWGAER